MAYYIRYTEHNDRNGLLDALEFFGPYDTFEAAALSIPPSYQPFDTWHGNLYATAGGPPNTWADNPDEPLCFYTIVTELPIKSKLGVNNEPAEE